MNGIRVVAVLGIQSRQEFVAQNNRLRQTIGASKLIDEAMEEWRAQPRGGEVLYIGGGNAALVFPSLAVAGAAIAAWSANWLRLAPGMRLTGGWAEVTSKLGDAWHRARTRSLPHNEEWGGLGSELGPLAVTGSCPDTGGPAVYDSDSGDWSLSAEARRKEQANQELNDQLRRRQPGNPKLWQYCNEVLGQGWEFPTDIDNIGLCEGKSHVAIVHCDGNGMAGLFAGLEGLPDTEFRTELARRSAGCAEATLRAVVRTLQRLRDAIDQGFLADELCLHTPARRRNLPVRPLVDSGDDITWIAHGRLGLYLAVHFCKEFEWATEEILGVRKTACAGVLLMPAGRPFSRAYQLAAALCASAKRHRRSQTAFQDDSWVDFHVDLQGAIDDLDWIRRTQYAGLISRPYSLGSPFNPQGTFELDFNKKWRYFAVDKPWSEARSRSKQLLEMAAAGAGPFQALAEQFAFQQYGLPAGWHNRPDQVFDALEMLDFHNQWPYPAASYLTGVPANG